jgi:hypothetical protein
MNINDKVQVVSKHLGNEEVVDIGDQGAIVKIEIEDSLYRVDFKTHKNVMFLDDDLIKIIE